MFGLASFSHSHVLMLFLLPSISNIKYIFNICTNMVGIQSLNRNQGKLVLRAFTLKTPPSRRTCRAYVGIVPNRYSATSNTNNNNTPPPWHPPVLHNHALYGYGSTIAIFGSTAMVVGEANLAWLHIKRSITYEIRAYSRSTMMLTTTQDPAVVNDGRSG